MGHQRGTAASGSLGRGRAAGCRALLGALLAALPLLLLAVPRRAGGATVPDGPEVTLPADLSGRLRWIARAFRGRTGQTVSLNLRGPGRGTSWSATWPDAYEPALRTIPDWLYRGHPLVALTLRHGAAAQSVVLLAPDRAHPPRRVAERLASAVAWRVDARGGTVLDLLGRDGSAVVSACHGWNGTALRPVPCPEVR